MARERSYHDMAMIRPVLRRFHSPDALNFDNYSSLPPGHFGLLVQAMIGPEGAPGEESFDFVVCTPSWLAERVADDGYVFGRHYLIVKSFDLAVIRTAIVDLCKQASGPDWESVANYLSRFGKWEFEDFQEGPPPWL